MYASTVVIFMMLTGVGIKIIISVSKIKKIIDTRKNRKENIIRDFEVSRPDSKVEGFSFLKLKFIGKMKDKIIKNVVIRTINSISKIIILYLPLNWKLIVLLYYTNKIKYSLFSSPVD